MRAWRLPLVFTAGFFATYTPSPGVDNTGVAISITLLMFVFGAMDVYELWKTYETIDKKEN